jgi:VIT1/CCC1 family predicted Fe2+/Mn2+ transporter
MLAYASAARVFGGLYPLTIFAFTRQRTRAFTVLAAVTILLTIFTFIRLVIVSPTLPYYVTP